MSDVPPDVLGKILSRLPVKSLLRFRSVSKPLCSLIDSPCFVNLHLQQSMKTDKLLALYAGVDFSTSFRSLHLDSNPTTIKLETPFDSNRFHHVLGSCHGLICLSSMPDDRLILLWNPSTRKHKLIETPTDYPRCYSAVIGITQVGYDHVNHDYKVVRLSQFGGSDMNSSVCLDSKFFVYSLKLNAWQSMEQGFPYKFLLMLCDGQGVCVSGALHWLVNRKPDSGNDYLIVGFDLANQRFESVSRLECFDKYVAIDLGILRGCLCVIGNREMRSVDVWVMREYGVKESWSKLVALTIKNDMMILSVRPLMYLKNGKEVLLEINKEVFVIYDIEKKKSKQQWSCDVSHISTFVYQESLV